MLSVISEKKGAEKDDELGAKRIHLVEENTEELLHSFLSEILWLVMQEGYFPSSMRVVMVDEKEIDAALSGVSIQSEEMKAEIKAITYHQLRIWKKDDKLFTRIIFDV
jgi:SHS2 domain-containing protein